MDPFSLRSPREVFPSLSIKNIESPYFEDPRQAPILCNAGSGKFQLSRG